MGNTRTIYQKDPDWKRLLQVAKKWSVSCSEAIRMMVEKELRKGEK